jgi:hypothetical protein
VSNSQTVVVERLEALPALLMTWAAHPKKLDIDQAFQSIAAALKTSDHSLFVIVDLRSNISLPIGDIVTISMKGSHHPKFAGALVIGKHQTARRIANILQHISKQSKIHWFKEEAEVFAYIENQRATNGS